MIAWVRCTGGVVKAVVAQ